MLQQFSDINNQTTVKIIKWDKLKSFFFLLGKYLQFVKLVYDEKLNEAAPLYIELLRSDICPK